MPALILYHYEMSPFSEKIRRMLGYGNLEWRSVLIPEIPPRPVLEKLVGGYRKIPVAQMGADVFCDSHCIATEIAALSGKPQLALEACAEEVQAYVARADLELFFACLMTSTTWRLNIKVLQSMSPLNIVRFAWDRLNIGRNAAVPMIGLREARQLMREHLAAMEARLSQAFLYGAEPNHADFSCYHSLWFARELAESRKLSAYPNILAWMDRMKGFGEGRRSELMADEALEIARQAQPRAIAPEYTSDSQIGQSVLITPSDYARQATPGTLVGSSPTQWIIAREQAEIGRVHIHFPKQGYILQRS